MSKAKERPWLEEPAMASETTPELEALVLGLFEVGAVKVRASLSLRARTCMLVTGRFGWKGLGLRGVGFGFRSRCVLCRVHTCMLATGRADGAGICLGAQTQFGELEAQERRSAVCTLN